MTLKLLIKNSDYISLDTIGFAQLGNSDYYEKIKVEKKIIENFFKDNPKLAVPLNYTSYAFFNWNSCSHDLGTYYDFVIIYDLDYLDELENENQNALITEFWDWVERCENALCENETELLKQMKIEYEKN